MSDRAESAPRGGRTRGRPRVCGNDGGHARELLAEPRTGSSSRRVRASSRARRRVATVDGLARQPGVARHVLADEEERGAGCPAVRARPGRGTSSRPVRRRTSGRSACARGRVAPCAKKTDRGSAQPAISRSDARSRESQGSRHRRQLRRPQRRLRQRHASRRLKQSARLRRDGSSATAVIRCVSGRASCARSRGEALTFTSFRSSL